MHVLDSLVQKNVYLCTAPLVTCRALNQQLIAGSSDCGKRQCDGAQSDPAVNEQLFRAKVAHIKVLRKNRNVQIAAHKQAKPAWRTKAANRAKLGTAHSQVYDALAEAAELSAFIPPPLSLNPPVPDSQWQQNDKELQHKRSAHARNGFGSASGPSTPSEIGATMALYQLSANPRVRATPSISHPTTAQQRNNAKLQRHNQQNDAVYSPAHRAEPNDSLEKSAEWRRFNEVAQRVVDCTTELRGKEHSLELLETDKILELKPSDHARVLSIDAGWYPCSFGDPKLRRQSWIFPICRSDRTCNVAPPSHCNRHYGNSSLVCVCPHCAVAEKVVLVTFIHFVYSFGMRIFKFCC